MPITQVFILTHQLSTMWMYWRGNLAREVEKTVKILCDKLDMSIEKQNGEKDINNVKIQILSFRTTSSYPQTSHKLPKGTRFNFMQGTYYDQERYAKDLPFFLFSTFLCSFATTFLYETKTNRCNVYIFYSKMYVHSIFSDVLVSPQTGTLL